MTYEVVDTQNISVQAAGTETKYLVLKVQYRDVDFEHTRTFELDPALTDEEITNVIVEAGQALKAEPRREINISGTI